MQFDAELNVTIDIPDSVIEELKNDVSEEYDLPKQKIEETDEFDFALEQMLEDLLVVDTYYEGDAWLCSITSYSAM